MRMRCFSNLAVPALIFFAIAAVLAQKEQRYSSLRVDDKGQLHIFTDSGREIGPARIKSQVSFGKPAISPDHLMVGWTWSTTMPMRSGFRMVRLPVTSCYFATDEFCNSSTRTNCFGIGNSWRVANGWHTPTGLCMGIRPNACCVMFNPDASLSGGFSTRKLNFPRGLAESAATGAERTVHYTLSKCLKPPVPRSMNEKSMKL